MDNDTIKSKTLTNTLRMLFNVFFNAAAFLIALLIALTVIISVIHDAWNGKIKNSYTYKECFEATNNPYNCMIYTNALFINQININESPYFFNQPKIDRLLPTPLLPAPFFNIETMNKVIKCTSDLKNQSNFIRYVLSQTDGCTLTAAAQQIEKGKAELAKEIEDTAKAEKEQKEKE
ncbi:hypothetical protein ATI02_4350 [Pseudomonas baetica]|uniref:Uncharacterized protein n=1 Tax=Pseudomonas baetica TaxID=674054 RepID=A0ABX4Q3L9_9PSED|nr:hypothetical protein [Pseudomonas baetica]PKA71372.1 hypothetical protein ATI02_4350 [Pseudomonas baetica]PTC19870.1 hypothetical protein C0J26_07685 [Pseudomonas baetica]